MSLSNVARCTEVRRFGTGAHAANWQCRLQPPHFGLEHDFGIDATVYGRDLNRQRPEWLAAQLRDAQALLRHRQGRVDELTAAAAQLAAFAANALRGGVVPISYAVGAWVRTNVPSAAVALDATGVRWHSHIETPQ